ncbi:MAG: hypothetical protein WAL61_13585 [Acidimicrobiales bacterium]
MRKVRGGGGGGAVAAAGVLCAVAATVAVWSGPLASASADLHVSAGAAVSHLHPASTTTAGSKATKG